MPGLIGLAYASLFALSMVDNVRGPLYPEILGQFAVSGTSGSLFFALVSLASFTASSTSSFVLRRVTPQTVLAISALVLAVGFAATTFVASWSMALLWCGVTGLAYGCLNVVHNLLVFEATAGENRRRAFNGLHAMYGLASLVAPLMVSALLTNGWNWRGIYLVVAIGPAIVAVSALRSSHGAARLSARPAVDTGLSQAESRACWIYALCMAAYLWGEVSVSSRLVLWLRQSRGYSVESANLCLALYFAGLLVARLFFTLVGLRKVGSMTLLSVSAAGTAILMLSGLAWNPYLVALSGLTMAPFYPVLIEHVATRFGAQGVKALGIVIGFGSLSLVCMHVFIGVVSDQIGLTWALGICGGLSAALAAGLWLLSHGAGSVSQIHSMYVRYRR